MNYNDKVPILHDNKTQKEETNEATRHHYDSIGQSSSVKAVAKVKKKQPPFLERKITVVNAEDVDRVSLLKSMQKRFEFGFQRWKRRSGVFKLSNLIVTLMVIALQVSQVILFQLPNINTPVKNAVATILPALTGAILAIQLKLAWAEKAAKCKKAARIFNTLLNHTEYILKMLEAGGSMQDDDSINVWNAALYSETKEIPAFLAAY